MKSGRRPLFVSEISFIQAGACHYFLDCAAGIFDVRFKETWMNKKCEAGLPKLLCYRMP